MAPMRERIPLEDAVIFFENDKFESMMASLRA